MAFLLSDFVERSAEKQPDHLAFRCQSQSVSYADLASQTSQLASFLIEQGVRRGARVGIFLPRCLESATAVHGILKSGAAFVPIDPNSPVIRLRQIIEDCGIEHLISNPTQRQSIVQLLTEPSSLTSLLGMTDRSESIEGSFIVGDVIQLPESASWIERLN